jgi:hypothetical protein
MVEITHEGKSYTLDVPEGQSILETALDKGIDLPHDCKLGVCMTCPAKLVSHLLLLLVKSLQLHFVLLLRVRAAAGVRQGMAWVIPTRSESTIGVTATGRLYSSPEQA